MEPVGGEMFSAEGLREKDSEIEGGASFRETDADAAAAGLAE